MRIAARRFSSLRLLAPFVVLALTGCVAPAATLLSPAITGAPAVADFLGEGTSDSYWVARRVDVVIAVRDTAARFDLQIRREGDNPERTLLVLADRRDETLRLRIEDRSEALTYVRFTGSPGMARLVSRQMAEELRAAGAFLVDWNTEPGAVVK
jgi:hypothetical protein